MSTQQPLTVDVPAGQASGRAPGRKGGEGGESGLAGSIGLKHRTAQSAPPAGGSPMFEQPVIALPGTVLHASHVPPPPES